MAILTWDPPVVEILTSRYTTIVYQGQTGNRVSEGEVETMYELSQINGKQIPAGSYPRIFEFRVTRSGTIYELEISLPIDVSGDTVFDVKTGTKFSDLTSIYAVPEDRATITSGNYTVNQSGLSIPVDELELISVNLISSSDIIQFASIIIRVEL